MNGSWGTYENKLWILDCLILILSNKKVPFLGFNSPQTNLINVDFPDPLGP